MSHPHRVRSPFLRTTLSGLLLVALAAPAAVLAQRPPGQADGAWLGVGLGRAPAPEASAAGEAQRPGVAITAVMEDSPAAEAGLRASDVITAVDGAPVGSPQELVGLVQGMDPGSWVPLTVLRRGDELELRARLASRPQDTRGLKPRRGWIGIEAIDLPTALREHFGAPAEAGVMVAHVAEGSSAEAAGLRLGDVIHDVAGEPVRSSGDLKGRLSRGGVGNLIELTVMRDGVEMVLEARIEAVEDRR